MNKTKKAQKRLQKRIADFDSIRSEGAGSKSTSKYVRTEGGKAVMYHKPGSMKVK